MIFTPVHMLEVPGGPEPAQRMYQDEDKTLASGIWAYFVS